MGYMGHFIVYLLAMVGLIILALYVYKKFSCGGLGIKSNHTLRVEDTLSLSPRKTLYVIRNGRERFLIAGDAERTTLISRLEESDVNIENITEPAGRRIRRNREVNSHIDLSDRGIMEGGNVAPIKRPIMKEICNKLNI